MIQKNDAFSILERTLSFSRADQTEVLLREEDLSLTRFAENVIHQNVSSRDHTILVRVIQDKRIGLSTVNRLDDESLERSVRMAEWIASLQEPDKDFASLPGPQRIPVLRGGFHKDTAECSPERRAEAVRDVVDLCRKDRGKATGAFQTKSEAVTVGNSLGVRAYFLSTDAQFSLTVRSPQGASGWAQAVSGDLKRLNVRETARVAIDKARQGEGAVELEAGKYVVVLEERPSPICSSCWRFLGSAQRRTRKGAASCATGSDRSWSATASPWWTTPWIPGPKACPSTTRGFRSGEWC
jgi:predicted Zn-dependent protease